MEQIPEIRVVGDAPPEKKDTEREKIENALVNHLDSLTPGDKLTAEKFEYPKTEKERAVLDFINRETSRLMEEAGIEPHNIPQENYHILPPELYKEAAKGNSDGIAFEVRKAILLNAKTVRGNMVLFGSTALHEALHLKSHLSIEVTEDKEGKINTTPYRAGVSVKSLQRDGLHGRYHEHFRGLHEGIVAGTEKRLFKKLLDQPELEQEKEWLISPEAFTLRKELAEKKEIPEEDIIWVDKTNKNNWEIINYPRQRAVLEYVCNEIQKQFPDEYPDTESVFKEFLGANFTGHLLTIGRLVEKTFGEGSFRLLGNMDTDKASGTLHLESLKKARARQIKATNTK
jgi:hypothetical protein